jgi:hypothetical protein
MSRTFKSATILVVLSFFLVPWANAADLSANYLYGRWVINAQNCKSPDSEYMEFNKNGTFEGSRTGTAETVGFWGLKEGILNLHMVTSPAFFDDLHKELAAFEGIYSYFHGRMVIFNTQNKSFEAFGVIGDEVRRTSAVKCP